MHESLTKPTEADATNYLAKHPDLTGKGQISWSVGLKQSLAKSASLPWTDEAVRLVEYRPLCTQFAYFDAQLNDRRYQLPSMFPTLHHTNIGFYILGLGASMPFSVLMTNLIPDLNFYGSEGGQFFPRWTYLRADADGGFDFSDGGDVDEWGYRRIDNITDDVLALYRSAIGAQVDKDGIFHYVYGVLHDPDYRTRYAADLKKMLPHIPTPDSAERFKHVADIGRQLAELHLNYEAAEPYPLDVQLKPGTDTADRNAWRVEKMRWRSKSDRSAILYNSRVTITGIPETAHGYLLGSRTALEWLIDRYQVKTDITSGIVNDPNTWCDEHDNPAYIIDLIRKITTVSVKTMELVGQLRNELLAQK